MAIGLYHYANRPEQFQRLPVGLVSHSFDHRDFSRFQGRNVVVIGGGQSAIEFAALLSEAGAAVQVVSRRSIWWHGPDRWSTRSTLERILAPDASIAPGWDNWVLDRMPFLFYRLPQTRKDSYLRLFSLRLDHDLQPLSNELRRRRQSRERRVGSLRLMLLRARDVYDAAAALADKGMFVRERPVR